MYFASFPIMTPSSTSQSVSLEFLGLVWLLNQITKSVTLHCLPSSEAETNLSFRAGSTYSTYTGVDVCIAITG